MKELSLEEVKENLRSIRERVLAGSIDLFAYEFYIELLTYEEFLKRYYLTKEVISESVFYEFKAAIKIVNKHLCFISRTLVDQYSFVRGINEEK